MVFQVDWGMLPILQMQESVWIGDFDPVGLLSEVELEPGVKVECVSKFCYVWGTH